MKNLFILSVIILSSFCFISCDYEDTCWVISLKTYVDSEPKISGYPQISTSTITKCGVSEREIKKIVQSMNISSTTQSGKYTIYTTQVAGYHKK